MTGFIYIAPPLPALTLRHPAVDDLAQVMRGVYPRSDKLGSMILLAADAFGEVHQDERSVQAWLHARFCDLPSLDRSLALSGVGSDIPRPLGRPLCTTAWQAAEVDAQTITSDPRYAAELAAGLFWYVADRVRVISTRSAASIVLDAPGKMQ